MNTFLAANSIRSRHSRKSTCLDDGRCSSYAFSPRIFLYVHRHPTHVRNNGQNSIRNQHTTDSNTMIIMESSSPRLAMKDGCRP